MHRTLSATPACGHSQSRPTSSTLRRANDHASSQPSILPSTSRRRPSKTFTNSKLAALWAVDESSRSNPGGPTLKALVPILLRENSSGCSGRVRKSSKSVAEPIDVKYASTPEEVVTKIAMRHQAIKCARVNIGPKGAAVIADALREHSSSLQQLDLASNVLGSAGARYLLEPILVPGATPKLSILNLENNNLDEEAGMWIANVLEVDHCPLQKLILGSNNLGPIGGQRIANAFSVNHSIVEIDLSQNSLNLPVGLAIIESMRKNSKHKLQKVDLTHNGLPAELEATFQALFSFTPSLWQKTIKEAHLETHLEKTIKEACAVCPGQRLSSTVGIPFLFDYLGAISDHWGNEEHVKHIMAALHAPIATFRHFVNRDRRGPTLVKDWAAEYNIDRIHHLAKLYVPRERVSLPSGQIRTQGLFVLNLTPFSASMVSSESKLVVDPLSGASWASIDLPELRDGYRLNLEVAIQLTSSERHLVRDRICVSLVLGEQRHTLDNSTGSISGHLRTMFSMKKFDSLHNFENGLHSLSDPWRGHNKHICLKRTACMLTLVWAPPASLSGIRLKELKDEWGEYQAQQNPSRKPLPPEPTMYDVVQSWVKPKTGPSQSSFAALCDFGPVETFVSHWWGSPFEQTLDALEQHDCTGELRVWICSFANNQWRVKQELGDDVYESPFRQALVSDSCTCMALMLDTDGAPLRRFWCLFEIMTVISLKKDDRPMSLDLCTPQGVLNRRASGNVPAEYNLKLVSMLAKIDVAAADCRSADDRQMITAAINDHLGGFEMMNKQIRERIEEGLHIMYEEVTDQFRTTHSTLKTGRCFDTLREQTKGDKTASSPWKVDSTCVDELTDAPEINEGVLVAKLRTELAASRQQNEFLQAENKRYKSECLKLRQELATAKAVSRSTAASSKAVAAPRRAGGSSRRSDNSARGLSCQPS